VNGATTGIVNVDADDACGWALACAAVPGNPTVAATSAITATISVILLRIRAAGVPDHVNDFPFMYSPPS
jgi:hypothetical protein